MDNGSGEAPHIDLARPWLTNALAGLWRGRAKSPRRAGAVEIGWLLDTATAAFVWDEPRRVRRDDPPPRHAKSVNYCPAILDHEARMFQVACPIDLRLAFRMDDRGNPQVVNLDGDLSTVRPKQLAEMLVIVNRREWRHPDRPVIQLTTPYVFLADEPVYMSQMPPMGWYNATPWPGLLIGGRLPIHIWPRRMMWAFEWFDTSRELVLRRGDPLFYVRFETQDPSRTVRLVEAERTPELDRYLQGIAAVANYMNRTFSLFKTAAARRPKRLLRRRKG